jgi:hypothetical protein
MVRSPRDRTKIRTQAIRRRGQAVVAAVTEAILSQEDILFLPQEAIPPVAAAAADAEAEAEAAAAAVGSFSERHHPAVPPGGAGLPR